MNKECKRAVFFSFFLILLVTIPGCWKGRSIHGPRESIYRFSLNGKLSSLDPHVTSDTYNYTAQGLAYESLLEFENDTNPLQYKLALARKMPETTDGGRTWNFEIQPGITFQNDPCFKDGKGRELIAEDFSYFFERVALAKMGSPVYSSFDGIVQGIDEFRKGKKKNISGVRVLSKYKFQVLLTKKLPRFYQNFAGSHFAPVPKECDMYYGDQISEHAIGTGAFRIIKFDSHSVEAVANENYRYIKAGLPKVKKVFIEVQEEAQPAWLKFLAGEFEQSGVPKDNVDTAIPQGKLSDELKKRGVQHFRGIASDVVVQHFNMRDPIWGKDKRLREAFALAQNTDEIIEKIYSGNAQVAHQFLDPNSSGYDPNHRAYFKTENLERARQLLVEAGYPGGRGLPAVILPGVASSTSRQSGELIARQLARVGIQVTNELMSWPEFMTRMKSGKFTVAWFAWTSDSQDPQSALDIFRSKGIPPEGQNFSFYLNTKYDQLVDEIESIEDGPKRMSLVKEALSLLERDLPFVPVVHRVGNQLYQPWVQNAVYTDALILPFWLKYRSILIESL